MKALWHFGLLPPANEVAGRLCFHRCLSIGWVGILGSMSLPGGGGIFGPMLQGGTGMSIVVGGWVSLIPCCNRGGGGCGYVQGVGTGHGMQRDMVGMREVRILLECCLVFLLIIFYCRTNSPGSTEPIKITRREN